MCEREEYGVESEESVVRDPEEGRKGRRGGKGRTGGGGRWTGGSTEEKRTTGGGVCSSKIVYRKNYNRDHSSLLYFSTSQSGWIRT